MARVLVPKSDMGDRLELAVARKSGAAVNYRFDLLQGFLTGYLEGATDEGLTVLNREALRGLLVDTFADPEQLGEPLADVRAYILAGRGGRSGGEIRPGDERAVETRRYQLAARLAMLFEEYTFTRPELLAGWEEEPQTLRFQGEAGAAAETERWQAALWRRLCRETPLGDEILPLPRAFDARRDEVVESVRRQLDGGGLHVFGFSGFGGEFLRMLEALSQAVDVQVYLNGPAGERFVEAARRVEAGWSGETGQIDHPALRNWAGVGAETVAKLDGVAERFTLLERPAEEPADGRLAALQQSIRRDEAVDVSGPDDSEASVRLFECPGLRREVEAVANAIWQGVAGDEERAFSDVAVAIPPRKAETYLAHIESVFHAFRRLPYTINSMSLEGQSPVLDAAELLLKLPFGRFTRGELLSLLVHPNVLGRFREVDEETWVDWVEALNILYGADREDQKRDGEHYLNDDLFNWEQGMRRLALGAFLDVPDERPDALLEVDGHDYLPESVSTSEVNAASALNAMVRSLVEDARWLVEHRADMQEWSEILVDLVDTYLVPGQEERDGGGEDLARVTAALGELGAVPSSQEVGFRTAYLFASDKLSGLQTGSGSRFTGGVVISTPDRLRGLPFEEVYMMGMGEGIYPATDPRSELDLRLEERQLGDLRPSERDRYHFLELLQSARRRLTLSWVGRESTTGESLPASSLVADLRRMLDGEAETTVHPLRRYDRHSDYFSRFGLPDDERPGGSNIGEQLGPNYHPEAFREAQLSALRERLEAAEAGRSGLEIWTGRAFVDAEARLFAAQQGKKRPLLRMIESGDEAEASVPQPASLPGSVRISQVVKFLKTPLQAKAKRAGGLYGDDEDALSERVEQLVLDPLRRAILRRPLVNERLAEGGDLADPAAFGRLYRRVASEEFAPGELPEGVFGEAAADGLSASLATAGKNFETIFQEAFGIELAGGFVRYELSNDRAGREVTYRNGTLRCLEAPEVDVGREIWEAPPSVSLVGGTPPVFRLSGAEEQAAQEAFVTLVRKDKPGAKDFLKGYVSHLALSALGEEYAETPRSVIVVVAKAWKSGPQGYDKYVRRLPAVTVDQARGYFRHIFEQLLVDEAFGLLPLTVVEEIGGDGGPASRQWAWRTAVDEDDPDGDYGGIETQYGPVHDYLAYPPPDDPAAVIRQRFRYHPILGGPP